MEADLQVFGSKATFLKRLFVTKNSMEENKVANTPRATLHVHKYLTGEYNGIPGVTSKCTVYKYFKFAIILVVILSVGFSFIMKFGTNKSRLTVLTYIANAKVEEILPFAPEMPAV